MTPTGVGAVRAIVCRSVPRSVDSHGCGDGEPSSSAVFELG